jgi:hypothetical protein
LAVVVPDQPIKMPRVIVVVTLLLTVLLLQVAAVAAVLALWQALVVVAEAAGLMVQPVVAVRVHPGKEITVVEVVLISS